MRSQRKVPSGRIRLCLLRGRNSPLPERRLIKQGSNPLLGRYAKRITYGVIAPLAVMLGMRQLGRNVPYVTMEAMAD